MKNHLQRLWLTTYQENWATGRDLYEKRQCTGLCPDEWARMCADTATNNAQKAWDVTQEAMKAAQVAGNAATLATRQPATLAWGPAGSTFLSITVRPPPGTVWEHFRKVTEDWIASVKFFELGAFYAFEQKGTPETNDVGAGFHVHIYTYVWPKTTPARVTADGIRTYARRKIIIREKRGFEVLPHDSELRAWKYLTGGKTKPDKWPAMYADPGWRIAQGLPVEPQLHKFSAAHMEAGLATLQQTTPNQEP